MLGPGEAVLRQGGRSLTASQGEGWSGALASLATLHRQHGLRARVRVVLSHHFVGLHLVAAPPTRLSAEEMAGWLHERMWADFGAEAETWRLAWQDAPPGRPIAVASLAESHYADLVAHLADAGARLDALAPWCVPAWARHGARLGRHGWLALLEPGRLVCLRWEHGGFTHLAGARLATPAPEPAPSAAALAPQLNTALARQALQWGLALPPLLHLLAPGLDPGAAPDPALPGSALSWRVLPCADGWAGLLA